MEEALQQGTSVPLTMSVPTSEYHMEDVIGFLWSVPAEKGPNAFFTKWCCPPAPSH